jgi:hypothetical protein
VQLSRLAEQIGDGVVRRVEQMPEGLQHAVRQAWRSIGTSNINRIEGAIRSLKIEIEGLRGGDAATEWALALLSLLYTCRHILRAQLTEAAE